MTCGVSFGLTAKIFAARFAALGDAIEVPDIFQLMPPGMASRAAVLHGGRTTGASGPTEQVPGVAKAFEFALGAGAKTKTLDRGEGRDRDQVPSVFGDDIGGEEVNLGGSVRSLGARETLTRGGTVARSPAAATGAADAIGAVFGDGDGLDLHAGEVAAGVDDGKKDAAPRARRSRLLRSAARRAALGAGRPGLSLAGARSG